MKFPGYEFVEVLGENSYDILGATYVLTMRTSKRKFMDELNRFSPSTKTYIVINDGYKNIDRPLCKQTPVRDVVYSYAQIFKHANIYHPNEAILLLEDDFYWKSNVCDLPALLQDIKIFVDGKSELDHYWLGCITLPMLKIPEKIGNHVRINGRALASHAVISTPKGMRFFIQTMDHFPCKIEFPDPFMSEQRICYRHHRQLCYQLFEDSPSQRESWPTYLSTVSRLLCLHERAEPVWTFSYKFVEYHVQLIVCILIFTLYSKVRRTR